METPVSTFPELSITANHQLWSLWEMIQASASIIVNHVDNLTRIREGMLERWLRRTESSPIRPTVDDTDRQNVNVILGAMRVWMEEQSLDASLARLRRVLEYAEDEDAILMELTNQLQVFNEVLHDELESRVFMYLPPEDARLYREPLAQFPKTVRQFKASPKHIERAARCYACGQYTACVFHCMGILQLGLYALAAEVIGTAPDRPYELSEWYGILEAIRIAIEAKTKLGPNEKKTATTDDLLTFYSGCMMQFRWFKDAWRNHVAHIREDYDSGQAKSILDHTRDFMEQLAERIAEQPLPPVNIGGQTLNP